MKLSKAIFPLVLLTTLCVPLAAQENTSQPADNSAASGMSSVRKLDLRLPAGSTRTSKDPSITGAAAETTQAEKQMKAEEKFQTRLQIVKQVIDRLDLRVKELRKWTAAPTQEDVDKINRDAALVDGELQQLNPLELSPLAQVQWSEQSDRLLNIKLTMDIMAQRWDSGQNVFGMSFFSSSPPGTGANQRPAPENYCLRIGDKLSVTVLSKLGAQDDHFAIVDGSGNVAVPGLGKVVAAGKTVSQVEKVLADKISSKFSQLRVQVTVASMASIQVQVSGEVMHPGTYTLSGLASTLNALYEAGGPTKSGTFRKIYLVRDREPKRAIDLYDFLINGSKKQDLPLKDGDLVFVPPLGPTVTVTGEVVRPGRYEPGFPTTLGAMLKMAGGAKSGGYLQAVQVERVIDNEYKVLLSQPIKPGDGAASFALKPGDAITVSSVRPDNTNQVSITGPVKAPGLYGLQEKMHLSDLVKIAQGFAPDREVYGGRADVLRIDPLKGTSIISVNLDKALKGEGTDDISLSKLDRVFIYEPEQVVFRPRIISISGAVARPGTYKRSGGMKISDAIAAAGGVLPSAHLERIDLMRLDSGEKPVLVRVDLQSALNGDPAANIDLQDRDRLVIYTYDEVKWRDSKVRIEGAVQRPGTYLRSEGMRLSDLLFAAGGLLPEAGSSLEVARCDKSQNNSITKINLTNQSPAQNDDMLLGDRDVVTVPAVNPSLRTPEVIYLSGEVVNPGPYVLINQDEKLADVIKRAGGLTNYADVNGLLFMRRKSSLEKPQQTMDSDAILQKARLFADKQFLTQLAKSGVALPSNFMQSGNKDVEDLSKPTEITNSNDPTRKVQQSNNVGTTTSKLGDASVSDADTFDGKSTSSDDTVDLVRTKKERPGTAMGKAVTDVETNNSLYGSPDAMTSSAYSPSDSVDYAPQNKSELQPSQEESARISVNLSAALKDNKSADNLTLRDGDRIFLPKTSNVVTVIGAVLHPHAFAADQGKSVKYFIERSGGFSQEAARGDVVVVRTNGDALPMRAVKSIMPGDTIVVPTTGLIDIAKKWERMGDVTKVVSDVLSSVFVLTRF